MNVFYLDPKPKKAAEYHCDKHVVKMCIEYAQLLSSAVHICSPELANGIYGLTHRNHPCAIWARSSESAFLWLADLAVELGVEYTRRYGKRYKSIREVVENIQIPNIPQIDFTEPPQCMPDQYKVVGNTVQAYRNYYLGDKSRFAVWKYTNKPDWWSYNV